MNINSLDNLFGEIPSFTIKSYAPNEAIFNQGEKASHIYAVEKGQVKLERPTIEGRSIIMYTAYSGDSFAEAALFSEAYHCNAIAACASVVHFYPKQEILDILLSNPQKFLEFTALLSSQVRSLRSKLELRNILSARDRILQYLLLTATPGQSSITIDSSLKDVAMELGLAQETLYRELSQLEEDGIISRDKKTIEFLKI